MLPRLSQGMFKPIHTLRTCPLHHVQANGTSRNPSRIISRVTCIETVCRPMRFEEKVRYPVVIFQPDIRTKNASMLLQAVTESYTQIKQRHGEVFVLTTRPDVDDYLSQKNQDEKPNDLPFPIYYLRHRDIADLTSIGIIMPDQHHLFLLTPQGIILKEKSCVVGEDLVSNSSDLIRWTSAHGSHAPDVNEVIFYRKK